MGLRRRRPCGAAADVKELEYISALQQTEKNQLREDGSIRACDIVAFLMSRHGIKVSEEEVTKKILGAFGEERKSDESNTDSQFCLDLIQILALLLIPLLLKAKQSLEDGPQPQASSSMQKEPATCFSKVRYHCRKGDNRWPDSDIIESVLGMMLHDATGDPTTPRLLTKDLIRQLLCFYGEVEASDNEQLLDAMASAATHDNAGATDIEGAILLDQHSFACALTHDVRRYDINSENRVTTNFSDVFPEERGHYVETVRTFPCIDYTADTFRSKSYVVVLWVSWILTYFAYLQSGKILQMAQLQCDELNFGCVLAQGIVNWFIIMFQLSIIGSVFVVCASVSNVRNANPTTVIVGVCAVVTFILIPFFTTFSLRIISTEKESEIVKQMLYHLSVICGFVLLVDLVINIFERVLPTNSLLLKFVRKYSYPNIHLESSVKQAASHKMNRLVRNACEVHKVAEQDGGIAQGLSETKYGIAMLAYSKLCDKKEEVEGFRQVWSRIWNGDLFNQDGIWLSTHLLSGNLAQVTVCVLLAGLFATLYTSETFQTLLGHLDTLIPGKNQRWRLILPLICGFICGELTIISIISKYIPSAINTVILFRSGGYESLKGGRSFLKLRFAVDNSSLLFGSIFWGTFYTSIVIGFFVMFLLGVFLWPDFAELIGVLFANIMGIALTVLLKWLVLIGFRRVNQQGYYRRYVALNNVVNIILESWNLALTGSYMVIRSLCFLVAATMFIGRVDVPFLSQDACFWGPFELDSFPLIFQKDLLAHEAHRHPYVERLGVMYMLKLRYDDDFGTRAGSYWRLLFVYALLPWMRKYRGNDESLLGSEFKFAANRIWTGRMPMPADSEFKESSKNALGNPSELEMLRKENDTLRALLFRQTKKSHLNSSCPPILGSTKTV